VITDGHNTLSSFKYL
jgi:hypothetical protein